MSDALKPNQIEHRVWGVVFTLPAEPWSVHPSNDDPEHSFRVVAKDGKLYELRRDGSVQEVTT